jgi:uncharacterized membrane protein
MKLAQVHHKTKIEPLWHVQGAVLAAIFLQLVLNNNLIFGPKYLVAGFEIGLLIALIIVPRGGLISWRLKRTAALLLIALISLANIVSLGHSGAV